LRSAGYGLQIMFESRTNFDRAMAIAPEALGHESDRSSGTALRAFGWPELTARINAARDLRRVLRRAGAYGSASFGDAAAGYFKPLDNGKQPVNYDALEHGKSCWVTATSAEESTVSGDREI